MRVCEGGNVYICGVWGWIWVGICVHLCVCAVFEITFRHRTFSDHFCECPDVINFVLTLQPKLPAGMGTWPKLKKTNADRARTQNIKRKPRKGIRGLNRRCSSRCARLPRTSPRFGAGQRWSFSLFFSSLPRIAMCPY